MRAVPVPRKSRARFLRRKAGRLYQVVSFRKVRRKLNLHQIHQLHRRNAKNFRRKRFDAGKLMTPIVAGDGVNLWSGIESPAAKSKPLLIASFPNGYSRSPRVKVLQKNRLSRSWVSRRRYRLHKYNPGLQRSHIPETGKEYEECVRSCRAIKRQASKYADVKFNFERQNVMRTVCIPNYHLQDQTPHLLEFHPDHSIRLEEFPSLLRSETNAEKIVVVHSEAKPGFLSLVKRSVKSQLKNINWKLSEYMPQASFLKLPDVIIWSSIAPPIDSGEDSADAGAQTLHDKLNALVEASKLAGTAFNSYNRMVQKLETVSPGATRTIRRATARRVARQ
ncbi:LAFA_0B05160g1_1 [Lachancea sp. 'fantastica']|nr:LAFA_0B05160g1_1 [Lachancea sp. 'fantastica']